MNKRQRGRGRKPNSHNNNSNPNRSLDSNGPDVKIRGSANTIFDKYTTLARDAASSGHRVKAENYLQHAEHYLRLMMEQQAKAAAHAEQQAAQQKARQQNNENADQEQSDDGQNGNNSRGRRYPNRRPQSDQNESQDKNTNVKKENNVPAEAPKVKIEAAEATPAQAEVKPKKPRRKKVVEAVADSPPDESIGSAAE